MKESAPSIERTECSSWFVRSKFLDGGNYLLFENLPVYRPFELLRSFKLELLFLREDLNRCLCLFYEDTELCLFLELCLLTTIFSLCCILMFWYSFFPPLLSGETGFEDLSLCWSQLLWNPPALETSMDVIDYSSSNIWTFLAPHSPSFSTNLSPFSYFRLI